MRRPKIARSAARDPLRTQLKQMAALLSLALACGALVVAAASSQLTDDGELLPELSKPLLEILHPTSDLVIGTSDLHINIAIREDLHGGFRDAKLCISMDPVFIPADVELEDGTSQLQETCFDQAVHNTTFHVDGLVPGLAYAITAGLISHSRIVSISMRTFEVWSTVLPELGGERMSVARALDIGAQHHNAGNRQLAARIYRTVLGQFPEHPYTLHMLGLVLFQDGDVREGYALIQRALRGNASEDTFHNSLGLCLKAMRREHEAVKAYRRALEIRPFFFQASLNLGDALQALGKWEDAMHEYRRVAASAQDAVTNGRSYSRPDDTNARDPETFVKDAWSRVCELVRITDGAQASEACLGQLIQRWPHEPMFRSDRGDLFLDNGQVEDALKDFESASDLASVNGMISVADTLERLGETEESLQQYQLILRSITPTYSRPETRIRIMRATVLPRILPQTQELIDMHRKRFESEIDTLHSEIESLSPTDMDPSRIAFSTAITLNAHNRNNRALREKLGRLYSDLVHRHRIIQEDYVLTHGLTPQTYRLVRRLPYDPRAAAPRRLRVGFVSRYLFNSGVGLFMSDLLPQFDTSKYKVVAFAIGLSSSMKARVQVDQIAEQVCALPKDLAHAREEILAANVDVLIYPEIGMDETTYFLSLSRLAPLQASWWGNADTTGVPTMDYRIVSEYEHESYPAHYSETTFQIKGMGFYHHFPEPHDYNASREQVRSAIMARFGLPADFRMYFSIESILHIHPDFDYALEQILEQDEHARIFLLGDSMRNRWRDQLVARIYANVGSELAGGRIFFLNDVDAKQELLLAGAADAVLASVHLTRPRATIQAFTAGVPVVTLPGELWGTRIAYGFYRRMGVDDLIAKDMDEYIALALRLAQDVAFRYAMAEKIKERRSRIHADVQAVEQWERFFDFAGAKLYPSGEDDVEDSSSVDSGVDSGEPEDHESTRDISSADDEERADDSKDEL